MGDASRRVLLAACVGLTIRPDAADAGYIVTTVAGNGSSACTGDGGPATGAKLGRIRGIVIDQLGRLIMSDTECTAYRRVDAAGIITTVAGNGQCGFADGPLLSAKLEPGAHGEFGIDLATGKLYTPDAGVAKCNAQNHRIRTIDFGANAVTTIAGDGVASSTGDGGLAINAEVNEPHATTFKNGKVYIAETGASKIRMINLATGIITSVAGNGTYGFGGDGGPATSAMLARPHGVAVDSAGNVLICDDENNRLRKVSASTGIITTIAGTGATAFNGDFIPAVKANLNTCTTVVVDSHDNYYVVDFNFNRVRKINRQGIIATIAGTGTTGDTGEGGDALLATFNGLNGLAIDAADNIYVADQNNMKVKKLTRTNTAPVANAGPDQLGYEGTTVQLSGMASRDPENDSLSFQWMQTAGPVVTLSSATDPAPTFTAPTAPATLTFSLVVKDDAGLSSVADTVSVFVAARTQARYRWRTAASVDLAAENTQATTVGGTQLHLRIAIATVGQPWGLQRSLPSGQVNANRETVGGTIANLATSDNIRETLTEGQQGNQRFLGTDTAPDHEWTFAAAPPFGPRYDLCVEGSTTAEVFKFGWSPTASALFPPDWQFGALSETTVCYDVAAEGYAGGTVNVFVVDSDRTTADSTLDTLSLDLLHLVPRGRRLALERDTSASFTAPVQVGSTELWDDTTITNGNQLAASVLTNTTLREVAIESRPALADAETSIPAAGQGEWDFAITAPNAPATYHYRVVLTDEFGTRLGTLERFTADATLVVGAGLCGNGIVDTGEQCDTSGVDTMTCNGQSCKTSTCGDGYINTIAGEVCDSSGLDLATCNGGTCKAPLCGDGYTNAAAGEACDSGGVDSATCNGTTCKLSVCGDGHTNLAAGEACDDGGVDTATCDANCTTAVCGDGYANAAAGEQCDSSGVNTATCNGSTCRTSACGDGVVNAAAGEQCDSSGIDTTTCNGGTCKTPACGDGYRNAATGEQCDTGSINTATCNATTCKTSACGDGYLNPAAGEVCDSSGVDTATCNGGTCKTPACGDGYVNAATGEQCDSSGVNTATCNATTCKTSACGDGYINAAAGEQCDSAGVDSPTCNATTCKTSSCGDGYPNAAAGEQCDSGGTDSMTCVGATCKTSTCGDGHVNAAAGEQCDSSGVDSATCNSGTCKTSSCGDGYTNATAGEQCDSSGVDSAACDGTTCRPPVCGDGHANAAAGEQCDSSGVDSATCVGATCKTSTCGDGYLNAAAGETCETGVDTATCDAATCSVPRCGDGHANAAAGEECDSSGVDSATCIGATCKTSTCGDGHVNAVAGEQCDSMGADTATCVGSTCKTSTCGDGHINAFAGEACDSSGGDTSSCNGMTCTAATCGDSYTNAAAGEECDTGGVETAACHTDCTLSTGFKSGYGLGGGCAGCRSIDGGSASVSAFAIALILRRRRPKKDRQ